MSIPLGPGSAAKIYFMEGFDGASESTGFEKEWIRYKMWHTASHDLNSPSSQPPITASIPIKIDSGNCHSPDPGGYPNVGADAWYQGQDRFITMLSPFNFLYEGPPPLNKSLNGLIWRSGSSEVGVTPNNYNNGLREFVVGSTTYCGFAFRFGHSVPSEPCCGALKVWMGDSQNNGQGSNGSPKYTQADPGEPSRWWNGFAGGAEHSFQEYRLCLEITTGSGPGSNNILIYRSAGNVAFGGKTHWAVTGSVPIETGKWYWGAWEVLPKDAGVGRTAFYLDGNLIVEDTTEDMRDGAGQMAVGWSETLSNLALAFRGPNQGRPASADPQSGQGRNWSGSGSCWIGAPVTGLDSPLCQVSVDDVVLFHDTNPAETYCVVLKSEEPANPSTLNFDPVYASTIWSAISESNTPPQTQRFPFTGSWVSSSLPDNNELSINYLNFPFYYAGIQPTSANTIIHGVQPLTFCSRTTSDFEFCSQSLDYSITGVAGFTAEVPIQIGLPGTGADGSDDPYVYISNWVHPSCSLGAGAGEWTPERINEITSSAFLGD